MSETKLSPSAQLLLRSMEAGLEVLVRATTGRASYSLLGHGERDCTHAIGELHKEKLVEIKSIDKEVGWVIYIAASLAKELGNK